MARPGRSAGSLERSMDGAIRSRLKPATSMSLLRSSAPSMCSMLVTPRPYRRRFFPHEAVRELLVVERSAFPREIIKALVELSAYPLGTLVQLTTGEVGSVVESACSFVPS